MSEATFIGAAARAPEKTQTELSLNVGIGWVILLWAVFVLSIGFLSVEIASRAAIVYSAGTLALFTLPGVLLMRAFFGGGPETRIVRAVFGAAVGIAISSYIAVAVGFVHAWSPRTITLAIAGLSAVCAAIGHGIGGRIELPKQNWTRFDWAILAGIGIVVVMFSASPVLHVGKLTSRGYAYTWLYGLDFVARSDFGVAMAHDLPPNLYWMNGVPLRMYLLGYAAPAFAFSASGKTIAMHSAMLLVTLFLGFVLMSCLYIFLRSLFQEQRAALCAMCLALFAYSYYWIYDAVKWSVMRPGERMQFYDSVSHLFQRMMLVEPQAALATCLLLIILTLMALVRYRLTDLPLAIFVGLCLGLSFGIDGMQAVVTIGWFGIFYVARFLLEKKASRAEWVSFAVTAISCAIVSVSFVLLGMYQRSTSHLVTVDFSIWLVKYGVAFFPIEFGPLLLLGGWSIVRWWRGSREEFGWPLLLLGGLATMQALLLRTTAAPRARMLDRLLPIMLAAFAAYLFRDWQFLRRRTTRWVVAAVILAAIPTFFTDIYFTSNINDLYNTRYVRVADQQACEWIRQNLPEKAVVQGYYNYFIDPDRGLYLSLISSFAQRPQVLGWFSGAATLVDDGWRIARERRADIEQTLASNSVSALKEFAEKYSVDYLYVGPSEEERFPQLLPVIQSAPDQFREIYSQNGVHIFDCVGRRAKV